MGLKRSREVSGQGVDGSTCGGVGKFIVVNNAPALKKVCVEQSTQTVGDLVNTLATQHDIGPLALSIAQSALSLFGETEKKWEKPIAAAIGALFLGCLREREAVSIETILERSKNTENISVREVVNFTQAMDSILCSNCPTYSPLSTYEYIEISNDDVDTDESVCESVDNDDLELEEVVSEEEVKEEKSVRWAKTLVDPCYFRKWDPPSNITLAPISAIDDYEFDFDDDDDEEEDEDEIEFLQWSSKYDDNYLMNNGRDHLDYMESVLALSAQIPLPPPLPCSRGRSLSDIDEELMFEKELNSAI